MRDDLLTILADGEFHSGEELGQRLGVSRTAIWKQLKKIEALGLTVQSVKGRGYCLSGGLDRLDAGAIAAGLDPAVRQVLADLQLEGSVDSTNRIALQRLQRGPSHGVVVIAEHQTAGRGRRGRVWQSPYAANIYLSMIWSFNSGAAALEGLSLAVGVALTDALRALGVVNPALKWPNDVLVGNRKLAGILLEMSGDAEGPCHVVIGIGVNVVMPASEALSIEQPWTDLSSLLGDAPPRSLVVATMLNHLFPALDVFASEGFAAFRDSWTARDAYHGKPVSLALGDQLVLGRARGVNDSGAIIIEHEGGMGAYNGGEISVRLADVT